MVNQKSSEDNLEGHRWRVRYIENKIGKTQAKLITFIFSNTNLVTRYGLPEVSCVIPKKTSKMDDETWEKLVKVVAPGIRKMKVINFACVFPILFSIYLTLHLCPSKLSSDDF